MLWHPATNLFCPSLPDGFIPPSPPATQRARRKRAIARHMTTYTGRVLCPGMAEYEAELSRIGTPGGMTGGMGSLSGVETGRYGSNTSALAAKMTAYYTFEETAGTPRADSTGNGNTASVTGTVSQVSGKVNNGMGVAGSASNLLTVADSAGVKFGATPWSAVWWAYFVTVADCVVWGKFTAGGGAGHEVSFGYYSFSNRFLRLIVTNSANADQHLQFPDGVGGQFNPTVNTWAMYAATYGVVNGVLTYVNANSPTSNPTTPRAASTAALTMGDVAQDGWNSGGFFSGRLDEFAKANSELSSVEIATLYNGGSGVTWGGF